MARWPDEIRDAKCLLKLREQVNELSPDRDKSSDGIRARKAHSRVNPNSDHEPHVMDGDVGVFTALDISHDPARKVDSYKLADILKQNKDPRIKYIISNHRIWNPSIADKWRPYKGRNPHDMHVHVSCRDVKWLFDSEAPWDLGNFAKAPIHTVINVGDQGDDVKKVQRIFGLQETGDFDEQLDRAVRRFQREQKLEADGIVGKYTWRALETIPPKKKKDEPQVFTNIVATVFGGKVDKFREKSAYTGKPIGENEVACSLPARFKGKRPKVKGINRTTGANCIMEIVDVGPWYTDDPYWEKSKRPLAEAPGRCKRGPNRGRVPNKAGIDLSPAAARALGIEGMGIIDWYFTTEED
jgi:hypothetical protein